jgi:hypothetical protein
VSFVKPRKILQQGTRANQPAATDVAEGTLYFVTDEKVVERSNLTTWDSWDLTGALEEALLVQDDYVALFRYAFTRLDHLEDFLHVEYGPLDVLVPEALALIED